MAVSVPDMHCLDLLGLDDLFVLPVDQPSSSQPCHRCHRCAGDWLHAICLWGFRVQHVGDTDLDFGDRNSDPLDGNFSDDPILDGRSDGQTILVGARWLAFALRSASCTPIPFYLCYLSEYARK